MQRDIGQRNNSIRAPAWDPPRDADRAGIRGRRGRVGREVETGEGDIFRKELGKPVDFRTMAFPAAVKRAIQHARSGIPILRRISLFPFTRRPPLTRPDGR